MIDSILLGISICTTWQNLMYCFTGCLVGTLVGVLPGIGPLAALSILLPVTFKIPAVSSIIMLTGIFYGAMYGGSTTSVLVNIPGEAASVVTCLDGHQMAKCGRAGPALGMAAISSFIAGTLSNIALTVSAPLLVVVALQFGPPEYFAVMTLGFVLAIFMVSGSIFKAMLMIALGLLTATVGMDPVNAVYRFTFGSFELLGGISLVAVIMGMFGMSEILSNMECLNERIVISTKIRNLLPNLRDWALSWIPILRGTAVGFVFGVLPGAGPVTASFVSYAVEKKCSRHPEKFGTGAIEGVAGPEAANNSAVAASMVPLLSLGLPSNAVTALLLGALIIHGIQPGPMLMAKNPDIFWGVIVSMYIGNVMLLILNLPLVGIWCQFLRIPYRVLFPIILILCVIGTYSENLNVFDIWVMIVFGLLGFVFRKLDYEMAPFILALVLGPLFEQSLRQSLIMSNQNFAIFISRPISGFLLLACLVIVLTSFIKRYRKVRVPEASKNSLAL
jgi:putative tricarboxylic transport membrane protein